MGDCVGDWVGDCVDDWVGLGEGDSLGELVGDGVFEGDDVELGEFDGVDVGLGEFDGVLVRVGEAVGDTVGVRVEVGVMDGEGDVQTEAKLFAKVVTVPESPTAPQTSRIAKLLMLLISAIERTWGQSLARFREGGGGIVRARFELT